MGRGVSLIRGRYLILTGLVVAAASLFTLVLAGPGYGFGAWSYRTGFQLMRYGAYGGLAGAGVSVLGLILGRREPRRLLLLGLVAIIIGGATAWTPYYWLKRARSVPPINDITTDTNNPPAYVAIVPLRADAPNSAEYGGPELAAQQLEAYPDIAPLILEATPDAAFDEALSAAQNMGWEIVAAVKGEGRIEAVATTGWFRFKDDVVVRLTPTGAGTRVDVRSHSRVGRSDIGTNARRIRAYLDRLES